MYQYSVGWQWNGEIARLRRPSRVSPRRGKVASRVEHSPVAIPPKSRRRRGPSRVNAGGLGSPAPSPRQSLPERRPRTEQPIAVPSGGFITGLRRWTHTFWSKSPDSGTCPGYNRPTALPSRVTPPRKPTSIGWGVAVGKGVATQRVPHSGFIRNLRRGESGIRFGENYE